MRQHKLCPDKQQYNNTKPFPAYVLVNEEVENYYECFKCDARTWNMTQCFYIKMTALHYLIKFT